MRTPAEDGRARGCLLYHGASTGRWAGSGIQPHNFYRNKFSDVSECLELVRNLDYDAIDFLYGDIMETLVSCVRGIISAKPGHDLICADYSAIEARGNAWLAGDEKTLSAFRSGLDIYKVTAAQIYHKKYEEVTTEDRRIGKVAVLALGYQGWVGAFQAMGPSYGLYIEDDRAAKIAGVWRNSHPEIKRFWAAMEALAMAAIKDGKIHSWRGGMVQWKMHQQWLCCKIPSGRVIRYMYPRIGMVDSSYGGMKPQIMFMGWNSENKKWRQQETYGGKLVENIVQATCRDIMAEGMLRAEAHGYPIILTVHDELISEILKGFGSLEEYTALMSEVPTWAKGFPIAAAGWRGERYRK